MAVGPAAGAALWNPAFARLLTSVNYGRGLDMQAGSEAAQGAAAGEHVVIVGAGFGGLACAKELGRSGVRVTVIDRHNYHLFVPLLYQVATAALSPADIAEPVRQMLRRYKSVDVILGEVTGIDTGRQVLTLSHGQDIAYDRLVVATGSLYNYFGRDHWARYAPGVKGIEDARDIRARLLLAFEKAEMSLDEETQRALMTTVIIGGGPTGVEMAGAVAELARHALARDFRRIDPRSANILLVEAGPTILSGFPVTLQRYAMEALERLGVEVLTGAMVEDIGPEGAVIGGRFVPAGTLVWAAGVKASPAGGWLGVEAGPGGRIRVDPDLSVPERDNVYAIGDGALSVGEDGAPLPALAQVAKQQGSHLGRAMAANILRGEAMTAFRFRNRGNTAIIGRHAAVFDFGEWKLKGRVAWLLWAFVHVFLLVGFENRVLVSAQWLWRYLTYQRSARLISWMPAPGASTRGDRPG